jgi:hypothetical protein
VDMFGYYGGTYRGSDNHPRCSVGAGYKRDYVNEREMRFIVCNFPVFKFFVSFLILYYLFGFLEV